MNYYFPNGCAFLYSRFLFDLNFVNLKKNIAMQIPADSVEEYLSNIPEERQEAFRKLYTTIKENLPEGLKNP